MGASQTTEFSDEHSTPASNVLPSTTSATALSTRAVRSMMAGTFPGPTPYAGLPAPYTARTMSEPPVARITAVSLCRINAFVPSSVATVIELMRPGGAPALTAASSRRRAVSTTHFVALGCGDMTMALRALTEIIAL